MALPNLTLPAGSVVGRLASTPGQAEAIPLAILNLATSGLTTVSTIANLKAIPAVSRSGTVLVLGRFSAADLGGGIYWWNANDTRADNGTTVIMPT